MRRRLLALAGALTLAVGLGMATGTPAFAGSGNQFCTSAVGVACFNAWGEGPFVDVYTARGTADNDFTVDYDPVLGTYFIVYTGPGSWAGDCIGDAYNSSTNNETSLDPCPGGTNTGGWGTNFQRSSCSVNGASGYEFKNDHWDSDIWPTAYSNGAAFALGPAGGPSYCFIQYGPA